MRTFSQKGLFMAAFLLSLTCSSAAQSDDFKVGEVTGGIVSFTMSTSTLAERFEAAFDDGTDVLYEAFYVVLVGENYWLQGVGTLESTEIRNFSTQLDTVWNGGTQELWLKPYHQKRTVDCLNECRGQDNSCKPDDSTGDGILNHCWPMCTACREKERTSVSLTAFWTRFMGSY
ncbi:MAG: hypothetical protein RRA94_13255 [Bacteroidota bacterium]|nr:hypothetical protein [Bacteroidota bacterium]